VNGVRFLLDANMLRTAAEAARALGHEVELARDIGLGDAPDARHRCRQTPRAKASLSRRVPTRPDAARE